MEMKPDVGRGGGVHQRGDGCNQAQLVAPFRRYEGVESFRLFSFPPNPPPPSPSPIPPRFVDACPRVCLCQRASISGKGPAPSSSLPAEILFEEKRGIRFPSLADISSATRGGRKSPISNGALLRPMNHYEL